jgi:hypothetical protein
VLGFDQLEDPTEKLLRAVLDSDTQDESKRAEAWRRSKRCLTQLVEAGMLREKRDPQTTYEFKHASAIRRVRNGACFWQSIAHSFQPPENDQSIFTRRRNCWFSL